MSGINAYANMGLFDPIMQAPQDFGLGGFNANYATSFEQDARSRIAQAIGSNYNPSAVGMFNLPTDTQWAANYNYQPTNYNYNYQPPNYNIGTNWNYQPAPPPQPQSNYNPYQYNSYASQFNPLEFYGVNGVVDPGNSLAANGFNSNNVISLLSSPTNPNNVLPAPPQPAPQVQQPPVQVTNEDIQAIVDAQAYMDKVGSRVDISDDKAWQFLQGRSTDKYFKKHYLVITQMIRDGKADLISQTVQQIKASQV